MYDYDPEKAVRVWQRVQGGQQMPSGELSLCLPGMIAQAWEDAAAYLYLSRRFQGAQSAMLRQMSQQRQSHAACLRGMYSQITGQRLTVQTPRPPQEPAANLLRRCYSRARHSLSEYEARSTDSEYGPVFARLADQTREHCKNVLEVLGGLREKTGERA